MFRENVALRKAFGRWVLSMILCCLAGGLWAEEPALEQGFLNPPDSARPHTWWHWMNGNITKEGITADLEGMKRAGVGGAQIFNVDCGIPEGPVAFMSPEWRALVKHAAEEADRLGIELCLHNCAGWSSSGGPWITPDKAMHKVVWTETPVTGPKAFEGSLPEPKKNLDFYRDIAVLAFPTPAHDQVRLEGWEGKAGFARVDDPPRDSRPDIAKEDVIPLDKIVNLTEHLGDDGHIVWEVPEGRWTLLRMGYTPAGKTNHPSTKAGLGLECGKMSREAAELHWRHAVQPVLDDVGSLTGKSLKHILIDSYEVGAENWSPRFREDFFNLRGYDPLLCLPAMTGRIIDSIEETERFLWDVRRTIADLFSENYFGAFKELCEENHLELSIEPYGNGGFDDLESGGNADIPMTEFWVGGGRDSGGGKLASSIAHTHGLTYVGAESFTATPEQGRWMNDPFSLKALGDFMYCSGVNRFIFHRYAMQPWLDRMPGMTMGPWGMHFERTNTWWEPGAAWLRYLARCQYLLQTGQFVADVCYFAGEGAPHSLAGRDALQPQLPYGYDYDGVDMDVLSDMSVDEGKAVTDKGGMTYSLLVLPPKQAMTQDLVVKVAELVDAGATVVAAKPVKTPGLSGYPECDVELARIADPLWGDCDGKTVTENAYGKGKVVWGKPIEELLALQGLKPDFEVDAPAKASVIAYIHRKTEDTDIYFVANWKSRSTAVDCTFRISGKQPELWHPETGEIEMAPVFTESEGRITVPLLLPPSGSVFVVFRAPVEGEHLIWAGKDNQSLLNPKPKTVAKLEITNAVYGVLGDTIPNTVNVTEKLVERVRDGKIEVRADNALAGDPAPNEIKKLRVDYVVNGQAKTAVVAENQTLVLPESPQPANTPARLEIKRAIYGGLPPELPESTKNLQVDVTDKLAAMVLDGTLSVVANNALAGDPANMIPKQLRVDYTLDGAPGTITVNENASVEIPEVNNPVTPPAELRITENNRLTLRAWESGTYSLKTSADKLLAIEIPEVTKPVTVDGPWEVKFPPNWGAPESVVLEQLTSWSENDGEGIKYFSGTATYRKEIDAPPNLFGKDHVVYLDLGRVKNMAQVRVNGTDLGVLWKPPFRVDITKNLVAGKNRIEISVTNLWPNRLIGDEQQPEDCEWNPDGSLKAWPAWLLEGQPRPSAGRYTFTTWKHYHKDSPLLESGLLGPVQLKSMLVKEEKFQAGYLTK